MIPPKLSTLPSVTQTSGTPERGRIRGSWGRIYQSKLERYFYSKNYARAWVPCALREPDMMAQIFNSSTPDAGCCLSLYLYIPCDRLLPPFSV